MKLIQVLIIVLLSFLLFSADKCKQTDTRGYMLAYAEEGTSRIRVRYSTTGDSWDSSEFPFHTTNLGVGVGADTGGILRIIPWATANGVNFCWGIGGIFEQNNLTTTTQIASSAPSAVYGNKHNYWYIAYRLPGNSIALRTYSTDSRQLLDRNDAPIENALNDNVGGRPALCRLGNKLIIAWERLNTIQFAVADISSENLTWTNKYTLTVPDQHGSSYYSIFIGDPTLTHDDSKFYLGIMRRTKRPPNYDDEFLVRSDLIIYSSSDGVTWTYFKSMLTTPVRPIVNIAARSDGSILAAFIGDNRYALYRLRNGSWTELDKNEIFNTVPRKQQFSLISVGRISGGPSCSK